MISFVVHTKAAPQGSKRSLGNGILIESSKRVKPFRADVREGAMQVWTEDWPMDAPMRASYAFHFRRPQSHFTTKGALTKRAPLHATGRNLGDIEKLARAVSDALSGVLFHDDSQVVELRLDKRYGTKDLVIISLEPLAS